MQVEQLAPCVLVGVDDIPSRWIVQRHTKGAVLEGKHDTGLFVDDRVDGFQARAQLFELHGFAKREVEVFRESVVSEITALECGTSLEGEDRPEVGLGETIQDEGNVASREQVLERMQVRGRCDAEEFEQIAQSTPGALPAELHAHPCSPNILRHFQALRILRSP